MKTDKIQAAKELLAENGYTVVRTKSYLAAQQRHDGRKNEMGFMEREMASSRQWALNCLERERHLSERLNIVWGLATAHGATLDELRAT